MTPIGIFTASALLLVFLYYAKNASLSAVSLPCITVLTSFIYFFLIPSLALNSINTEFLGMQIESLRWTHFAVLLYTIGALAAFVSSRRDLLVNPAKRSELDRQFNGKMFALLSFLSIAGLFALISLGSVTFFASNEIAIPQVYSNVSFLNLAISMMLPLTLVALIRDNFRIRSLAILAIVLFICLTVGFRFRVVLLASAVVASYAILRNVKIRTAYVVAGSVLVLIAVNAIGLARTYGRGLDLSAISGMSWQDLLVSFGGEVGPIYVLVYIANSDHFDYIYFTPWTVGIARLIPSFIWPDKPYPFYLSYFVEGFDYASQHTAGVAPPQQAEILLQFGWLGLPFVTFMYFKIACILVRRLNYLGREARIAGCTLAPAFFGFYMQQRGYFFQILAEGLFTFGPLFLLHLWDTRPARYLASFPRSQGWKGQLWP